MKPILPILKQRPHFAKRFWEHADVVVHGFDLCWNWKGMKDRQGYGMIKVRPKMYRAHRVAWVIINKEEIPDGFQVCHKCDNPSCVNPTHLFLGINADNVRDKVSKGRQSHAGKGSKGELHPRAKLTEKEVLEIRRQYIPNWVTARDLAFRFGVSEREIRAIIYRQVWTHI